MKPKSMLVCASILLLAGSGAGFAQSTAPVAPLLPPPVVANPTYRVIIAETVINRPASEIWDRVGGFCAIAEWARATCTLIGGKDREVGAVRLVNNSIIELLAGRTDLSYTYVMPVRVGVPYNAMHGTIEAKPLSARTTRLIYTHVYDNSVLADDGARATEMAARQARVNGFVNNMKILAEGGKLAPLPR